MSDDLLARAVWRKSSRSGNNGSCVEVALVPGRVTVRDSTDPAGPALVFDSAAMSAFLDSVKSGRYDGPA